MASAQQLCVCVQPIKPVGSQEPLYGTLQACRGAPYRHAHHKDQLKGKLLAAADTVLVVVVVTVVAANPVAPAAGNPI